MKADIFLQGKAEKGDYSKVQQNFVGSIEPFRKFQLCSMMLLLGERVMHPSPKTSNLLIHLTSPTCTTKTILTGFGAIWS